MVGVHGLIIKIKNMKYLLLITQLLLVFFCIAQNNAKPNDYIIYLTNGDSVIGHFINQRLDNSIILSVAGTNHLYYKKDIANSSKYSGPLPTQKSSPLTSNPLINKSDSNIVKPSRYDSLYKTGVLTKAEYDLLSKSKVHKVDSNQLKLDKYEGLLKNRQITGAEYNKLREGLIDAPRADNISNTAYEIAEYRSHAIGCTIAGSVFMFLSAGLISTGLALHVSNGGTTPASIGTGVFGGLSLISGICLWGHGGALRHRANVEEYEMRR